jgi:hypothetical protein
MTGCPNEVSEEKKCECSEKGHLLPCECGADNCDCAVIPYGHVNAASIINPNERIPVYMTEGVTEGQMATFIANLQSLYNNDGSPELSDGDKNDLVGKIKEIRAVPSDTNFSNYYKLVDNGKYEFELNYALTSSDVWDLFFLFLQNELSQVRPEKSVKLAALPKTAPYPRAAFGNGSAGTPGASFA